ncbi:hypothetical protein [Burkholderia multivorans]|uniref:hypothetical protein n=1 Tax=Burkholderia multivorans TaxID=87883 RepID=UPI0015E28D86|nr:hypothetical protein [Burkholderia multivorans]MDN7596730.1 hypothetical protein [Burkholderia multivorans]
MRASEWQAQAGPAVPHAPADYPDAVISKIERFEASIGIHNRPKIGGLELLQGRLSMSAARFDIEEMFPMSRDNVIF